MAQRFVRLRHRSIVILIGTLSAQACVDILSEVKPDRKRKAVTGLPTVVGVPVPEMPDDDAE